MADEKRLQDFVDRALIDTDTADLLPVDVVTMAKRLGFAVHELPLGNIPKECIALMLINSLDEELKARVKSDKLIVLREDYDAPHKRFAVAHELGHYFMHKKDCETSTNPVFFTQVKDDETGIEGEACRFAAMLLMDSRMFSKEYAILRADSDNRESDIIRALAKKFVVPQRAVERRIKELELA